MSLHLVGLHAQRLHQVQQAQRVVGALLVQAVASAAPEASQLGVSVIPQPLPQGRDRRRYRLRTGGWGPLVPGVAAEGMAKKSGGCTQNRKLVR